MPEVTNVPEIIAGETTIASSSESATGLVEIAKVPAEAIAVIADEALAHSELGGITIVGVPTA